VEEEGLIVQVVVLGSEAPFLRFCPQREAGLNLVGERGVFLVLGLFHVNSSGAILVGSPGQIASPDGLHHRHTSKRHLAIDADFEEHEEICTTVGWEMRLSWWTLCKWSQRARHCRAAADCGCDPPSCMERQGVANDSQI
jgi:hypothetical protein